MFVALLMAATFAVGYALWRKGRRKWRIIRNHGVVVGAGALWAATSSGRFRPEAAASAREIEERFGEGHPEGPFFHLTILATHSRHRGKGLGMGLLTETLTRVDALGGAAYLESTNPVNDERYRSVGFEPRAELVMPGGQVVTTMWRPAR